MPILPIAFLASAISTPLPTLTSATGSARILAPLQDQDAAPATPQEEPQVVPHGMSAEQLARAREAASADAWAAGERLLICRQLDEGPAMVLVAGDFYPLDPVPNSDLWAVGLSIPELDRMLLTYAFYRPGDDGSMDKLDEEDPAVFRGPKAPRPPLAKEAPEARTQDIAFDSQVLGISRNLRVYLPPKHDPQLRYPVIYMTDGGGDSFAAQLEGKIEAGQLRSTILVGIPHGAGKPEPGGMDRRARDYLLGLDAEAFASHATLFAEEVRLYAETHLGASQDPRERAIAGCSNGASLALSLARQYPGRYGHVIALSFGWSGELEAWREQAQIPDAQYHLAAGRLEGHFLRASRELAELLRAKGAQVRFTERYSGHDSAMWREEFAHACLAAFPVQAGDGK